MDTFEHDNRGSFDGLHDVCPLVSRKVVSGNLHIPSVQQLADLLVGQVEVEGVRMVEVVVGRIVVLIVAKD